MNTENYMPLIHVNRAGMTESTHYGAFAITRPNGDILCSSGNIHQLIFPRSAIKIFQALPLVISGAADAYGLTDAELSLVCASHSGEPHHIETAHSMLAKTGLSIHNLDCGAHAPTRKSSAIALAVSGELPTSLHNNCSGKHIGMLASCKHLGLNIQNYIEPHHPLQIQIRQNLEVASGYALEHTPCGIDGCSVPTWALPIHALATAFARIGSGEYIPSDIALAADRLMGAVWDNPFLVGGTGRFDSDIMSHLKGQVFTKIGAEGVMCGYFVEQDLGVAIKCADGSERGACAIMAAIIQSILEIPKEVPSQLQSHLQPKLTNVNGVHVGEIQPTTEFVELLIDGIIRGITNAALQ